jgi:hypothetical protein
MPAWFRNQPPEQTGVALNHHLQASYQQGALITPEQSASALLAKRGDIASGAIRAAQMPDHHIHDERTLS